MTVLAKVTDPDGRRVELTTERWHHVVDAQAGHPELADHRDDVMLAVREPHEQRPGRRDVVLPPERRSQPLVAGRRSL